MTTAHTRWAAHSGQRRGQHLATWPSKHASSVSEADAYRQWGGQIDASLAAIGNLTTSQAFKQAGNFKTDIAGTVNRTDNVPTHTFPKEAEPLGLAGAVKTTTTQPPGAGVASTSLTAASASARESVAAAVAPVGAPTQPHNSSTPDSDANTTTAGAPATTNTTLPTADNTTVEENISSKPERLKPSWGDFATALESKDTVRLRQLLAAVSHRLREDPAEMDLLTNLTYKPKQRNLSAQQNQTSAQHLDDNLQNVSNVSFVAAAAAQGWLSGLEELVKWRPVTQKAGRQWRLGVDDETDKGDTPLLLAVEAGHADVVQFLLARNASVNASGRRHLTPLELAVREAPANVTEALLSPGSELFAGMLALQQRLLRGEGSLPMRFEQWPPSFTAEDGQLSALQDLVPSGFRPAQEEREWVGNVPAVWLLFYKTRVFCSFAQRTMRGDAEAAKIEHLLAKNGFDELARDFSFLVIYLSVILSCFALLTYLAFRLRAYGWLEVPISLAELIPGAFDPMRLADPDFDGSKLCGKLPYRSVKAYFLPKPRMRRGGAVAFMKALVCIYFSCCMHFVRIPPESDPYDEDYFSDDDDVCRRKVRKMAATKAYAVRNFEVIARIATLVVVLWWFQLSRCHSQDAVIFGLVCLFYACVVSSVASRVGPTADLDRSSQPEEWLDGARVTYALFSVQVGPRWVRAAVSTRSTATPGKSHAASKQRYSRRPKRRSGSDGASSGTEGANQGIGKSLHQGNMHGDSTELLALIKEKEDGTAYSDWFQRQVLRQGVLHIKHGSYLLRAAISWVTTAFLLLWLFHLRWVMRGSFTRFYRGQSAKERFQFRGTPYSAARFNAVILQLFFLAMVAERLLSVATLAHVLALSLLQRRRALEFLRLNQPPALSQDSQEASLFKEAMQHIRESGRCLEFALELSTLRWHMLREAVLATYVVAFALFVLSVVEYSLVRLGFHVALSSHFWVELDPEVPLCIALCILWPLASVLHGAVQANREIEAHRVRLAQVLEQVLSHTQASDVEFVQLKIKAAEATAGCVLCWPGGREVGHAELCLLLCVALLVPCAVLVGAVVGYLENAQGG